MKKIYNVLFLCTGNSARSVMAETLLNHWGKGRFRAYQRWQLSDGPGPSPDARPAGALNSASRPSQQELGRVRSAGAPVMDFVFTVCDQAAGEVCPVWPGQPITAHWGFPDPAAFSGMEAEKRAFFAEVFRQIESRIKVFAALPMEKLDRLALQREVRRLGMLQLVKA